MFVEVKNLTKRYGNVVAVDDVSLGVEEGELITLLGPSGCGKTTAMRCVCGLERPEAGEIYINGKPVSLPDKGVFVPPHKRNVGMVFQSYAIWPHMTVYDNIAYGLRLKKVPKREVGERVNKVLGMVGLEELKDRYATQLSGGQQQRVAVARSVVTEPQVLLFDEPLSNLDAKLRERMRFELRDLQKRLGITSIYVTHDQAEAMVISDRIILMNRGKIVQEGSAREIYDKPLSKFVADFIGLTNFFSGKVTKASSQGEFSVMKTDDGVEISCVALEYVKEGAEAYVSIRPEDIKIYREKPENLLNVWRAEVTRAVFLGSLLDCYVRMGDRTVRVQAESTLNLDAGQTVYIQAAPERCNLIAL